jgi:hypothetical protein
MTVCIRRVFVVAFLAGSMAGVRPAQAQSVSSGPETLSYQAYKPRVESSRANAQSTYYDEDASAPRRPTARVTAATSPVPKTVRPAPVYTARRAGGTEEVSPQPMTSSPAPERHMSEGFYDDDSSDCGDCCNGPPESLCDCFHCGRRGAWFIGAEAYFARLHFSEAVSYVDKVLTMDQDENLTTTDTSVEYNFPYKANFKGYFGYRFCDCGTEIRFSYWHFTEHASKATGPVPDDLSEIFGGQLENNAGVPGDRLFDDFKMRLNQYDLDFAKCIPVGCCDDGCCPPWELKWSAGIRFLEVRRQHNNLVTATDSTVLDEAVSAGLISADYFGVGPKVGLEGRRYCNQCRSISVYGKSNLALLVGQYDVTRTRLTPPTEPVTTTVQIDNITRCVPVAEIEVGSSWQVFRHTLVSIGWEFQAYWDLGMFESIQGSNFGPMDDSNIMSFDGGFVRVEMTF